MLIIGGRSDSKELTLSPGCIGNWCVRSTRFSPEVMINKTKPSLTWKVKSLISSFIDIRDQQTDHNVYTEPEFTNFARSIWACSIWPRAVILFLLFRLNNSLKLKLKPIKWVVYNLLNIVNYYIYTCITYFTYITYKFIQFMWTTLKLHYKFVLCNYLLFVLNVLPDYSKANLNCTDNRQRGNCPISMIVMRDFTHSITRKKR